MSLRLSNDDDLFSELRDANICMLPAELQRKLYATQRSLQRALQRRRVDAGGERGEDLLEGGRVRPAADPPGAERRGDGDDERISVPPAVADGARDPGGREPAGLHRRARDAAGLLAARDALPLPLLAGERRPARKGLRHGAEGARAGGRGDALARRPTATRRCSSCAASRPRGSSSDASATATTARCATSCSW